MVLIGWALDIEILKSISLNFVTMKANTALAFLLAGISLLLSQEKEHSKIWKKNVGVIAAALVALIGSATLSDIIFYWGWGFDELLFKEKAGAVLTAHLGRMAPMTAINFILVGLALIFLNFERRYKEIQYISFFVFMSSYVGFLGYLYDVKQFYGVFSSFTPMAINTSIIFFVLAMGIVVARPKYGPIAIITGDDAVGVSMRKMIPISIIIPSILGYIQVIWHNADATIVDNPESKFHFLFHLSLLVNTTIIVFLIVVWRCAFIARTIEVKRKIIANKLKEEANKTNILMQSIGDAVIAIDRNWKIILWNKSAEKLSGWTEKEVLNKPFRKFIKLIQEGDRSENIRFIEDAILTGKVNFLKDHTLLITKDGKEISVGDSAAPIFNDKKEAVGAIIIMRDVTKEQEASLLRSDFSYASHQLRTPVTKALWFLEIILEEKNLKKIRENTKIAYQAIESIKKLSGELITVSEIDQKTIIPDIKPIKLANLFDDLLKEADTKIKNKFVKIKISPISVSASINTDKELFKRALAEVLDNAIIYSSEKSEINIDIKPGEDVILIQIKNYGIGITREHQPLAFTKFFRGSNFSTTEIMGAGLGLYIAKEYIKLLKGKIWFKSEENKETIFFVSIPL